jgi:hypothetical protein
VTQTKTGLSAIQTFNPLGVNLTILKELMEIKGLSDLNETFMSKMIKKHICNKSYSHIPTYHVLIDFMKKGYTKITLI